MAAGGSFALIVGSGMADFGGGARRSPATTRYGQASAAIRQVEFGARTVLVLPRHGDDHALPPHRINYRANLLALSEAGATDLVSVNTVGVIPGDRRPGDLAVPAQLIDYTWGREHTLFTGDGDQRLQHVDFTLPFSDELRRRLLGAAAHAGLVCHDGGIYGVTQGPRLETAAEVDRYEHDGVDYIGMTLMPEAGLARELGMRVACLSLIVNPAAGRGSGAIHADIEASLAQAKSSAVKLLQHFFQDPVM